MVSLLMRIATRRKLLILFILTTGLGHSAVIAADDDFFEAAVKPILKANCFKCHSHQVSQPKGDLLLDSVGAILTGGESGPAVEPGKPDESGLLDAVKHRNGLKMPPDAPKISAGEIAIIERWVKDGARGGNVAAGAATGPTKRIGKITVADRQWWSFRPIARPAVPNVSQVGWVRNDIDRFVLAKLETEGLTPAPEADKATLCRRLYFDLWGLPPRPEDIAAYVSDQSSGAYEALVDRLLADGRYGEKWARQWLDLVRYAESDGYKLDDYRPNAWRYRDYVIQSLNDDKPYNRFVEEQLAGDELYPDDPQAQVATGYLHHWIYEYNSRDVEGQWRLILTDLTDTTGDVFMGLGMQCARCHDHKFDPILQKDYFRLQAFFAGIRPLEETVVATRQQIAEHEQQSQAWNLATAEIRQKIDQIESKYRAHALKDVVGKFPEQTQAMIAKTAEQRSPLEQQLAELALRQASFEYDSLEGKLKSEDKENVLVLRRKLAEFDKLKPAPLPTAMTVTDVGPVAPPIVIPKKGKQAIAPGFLTLLDEKPAEIVPLEHSPKTTGRRAALAKWLTNKDNPLTARVVVNRAWQSYFGKGLAANASDFGKLGQLPVHPELLDWLASRFLDGGGSLKKLHREILLSATYRQAANHPSPQLARQKDPENRWFWRANTRRLEAEQIRDSILAVSGELKHDVGGPSVSTQQPRRTVYCRMMRNERDPLLDVFDAPYWFQSSFSRDCTTTPVQSLMLFNSPYMLKRADAFAARLENEAFSTDAQRIDRAYQLAFGRMPLAAERQRAIRFFAQQSDRIDVKASSSTQAKFLAEKIPHRDGQAAAFSPTSAQRRFEIAPSRLLDTQDFTIEAFVLPRSVYESGSVRTIAAKWTGSVKQPGWGFGITGGKSRRKPQTLVMQLVGKNADGNVSEAALFSDQTIQLTKPYYVAAAVQLSRAGKPGKATFFLKDLSNDDEPLLTTSVQHDIRGPLTNSQPLTIGGRMTGDSYFDGLLDDVRISDAPLEVDRLLYTAEGVQRSTIGFWQFETKPDVLRDSSDNHLDLRPETSSAAASLENSKRVLWRDFCHVLLNSSEFLYVD